jgi:uncharacterized protein
MRFRVASALLLSLWAGLGVAASFDCATANHPVERWICEDSELSELDDVLDASYGEVLAIGADPGRIRADQRRWVREVQRRCEDADCIERVTRERITALEQAWNTRFAALGQASAMRHAETRRWRLAGLGQGGTHRSLNGGRLHRPLSLTRTC